MQFNVHWFNLVSDIHLGLYMRKYLVFLYALLCINLLRCSNGNPAFSRKDIHFMEKRSDGVYLTPFFPDQSDIELPCSAEVIKFTEKEPQKFRYIKKPKLAYFVSQYNTLEGIRSMFYFLKDETPFRTITLGLFPVVEYIDERLDSAIAKERLRQDMLLLIKEIGYFRSQVKTELASYKRGNSSYKDIDNLKSSGILPLASKLYAQFGSFIKNNKPEFDSKCPSTFIMMIEGLSILYLLICCWQVEVWGKQNISFDLQRIAALVGAGFGTFCLLNDMNDVSVHYKYLEYYSERLEKYKKDWLKILNDQTFNEGALEQFNNLFSDIQQEGTEENALPNPPPNAKDNVKKKEESNDTQIATNPTEDIQSVKSSNQTTIGYKEDPVLNSLLNKLVSPTLESVYDEVVENPSNHFFDSGKSNDDYEDYNFVYFFG